MMINAKTPNVTPTPMPIFAPWLRPLLPGVCVLAVELEEEEEVGDAVDSRFVLAFEAVLVVGGLPVLWVQNIGFSLLWIATLKVPLMAKGGPKPTAAWRESSKWQLNGSSA